MLLTYDPGELGFQSEIHIISFAKMLFDENPVMAGKGLEADNIFRAVLQYITFVLLFVIYMYLPYALSWPGAK